jgi:L-asparaginase II
VENRHYGSVVALDRDGSTAFSLGAPDRVMYPRSSNKPMQLVGMLRLGLKLDERQLAIATSSHSGEAVHLAVVESILRAYGLNPTDLDNVADLPYGDEARADAIRNNCPRSPLLMNCSGKHAAMLATCTVNGWSTAGYREPTHPLQQALTATIDQLTGHPHDHFGIDGCGAPAHAFPLLSLAHGVRAIALADDGPEHQVREAVRRHPHLVGGTGRDVTAVIERFGALAKDGAEGVFVLALPDGRTVAVKIDDGTNRARVPVLLAALQQLGINTTSTPEMTVRTYGHNNPVGQIRATF